ncbi:MAG: YaaC family protein [bacterium]
MPTTRNFIFNKNSHIASLYTMRSTNILDTIWKYLGRYKSIEYTKSVLTPQIISHSTLIDKKAEQISFTIRQAEEFFLSARKGDISIKPLLTYYGILGLAKCLILSGDNAYTLEATQLDYDDHGTHGLSWKANVNVPSQVAIRDSDSLAKEFCFTKTRGIYPLFRKCYANVVPPDNSKIDIESLLSLIGENWQLFNSYFSKAPNLYNTDDPKNGDVEVIGDNKQIVGHFSGVLFQFHKQGGEDEHQCVERLFPELNSLYDPLGSNYRSKQNVTAMDSHIVFSRTQTLQAFALIQPFSNFKLTDFDIYFILFFILSNLCRYRQDKWYKISQRMAVPDEFFLIENLFEVVQYKFPLMILRELEGKDYRFIGDVATYG